MTDGVFIAVRCSGSTSGRISDDRPLIARRRTVKYGPIWCAIGLTENDAHREQ